MASHISISIATGERLHSIREFEMLLKRGAVQYVRLDVAGEMTRSKKIAALVEASYVGVVPPQPAEPRQHRGLSSARGLHPKLFYSGIADLRAGASRKRDSQDSASGRGRVFLDTPGIGMELADDALEKYPPRPREVETRLPHRRFCCRPVDRSTRFEPD